MIVRFLLRLVSAFGVATIPVATALPVSPVAGAKVPTARKSSAISAVNCPDTWLLTSVQRGLNPRVGHVALSTNVIPPNALWVTFCLYGFAPSSTSNAGGSETLVISSGNPASKEHTLINAVNRGKVIRSSSNYHCPFDNGQTYLLLFTYKKTPTVGVAASLFGCQFITNGVRTVRSPHASAILRAMAGPHTQGGPPLNAPTTQPGM